MKGSSLIPRKTRWETYLEENSDMRKKFMHALKRNNSHEVARDMAKCYRNLSKHIHFPDLGASNKAIWRVKFVGKRMSAGIEVIGHCLKMDYEVVKKL